MPVWNSTAPLLMLDFERRVETRVRARIFMASPWGKDDGAEEGEWCLVSCHGDRHRLPKTMIFLGKEECDIDIQAEGVDKRHAVVTFDHYLRRFKIKDLSTESGTFVNNSGIPEQEYVVLEQHDTLRLGNDHSLVYRMERYEEEPPGRKETDNLYPHETSSSVADLSHHTNTNGHHDDDLPNWASSQQHNEDLQSPMAECRGCIAEQRIEHTCAEGCHESETAHRDLDRSYSETSIASFSLGCNTWPKKRYKGSIKKTAQEIFAAMDEECSNVDGLIDTVPSRVLRGTGAPMNILPNELSTVKKGTPLYGQPKWWGEEEESDLNTQRQRASSMEGAPAATSPRTNVSQPPVPKPGEAGTDTSSDVPNANNVPTSNNTSTTNPTTSTTPEGIANMAFTIDFGDEPKSANVEGRSLGDFMPPKLRKSFRERQESKSSSKASKSSSEKVTPEKSKSTVHAVDRHKVTTTSKTTPEKPASTVQVRAVSEGREVSPICQHKIDEVWATESATAKRLRMMSKSSSSKSTEDDSVESSYTKGTKSSTLKRHGMMPVSAQSKPKSVIRARKATSQEVLAPSTQYNKNSAYLIDKMFRKNSTGSVDSLKPKGSDGIITEHDLYHESIKYDTDQAKLSQSLDFMNKRSVGEKNIEDKREIQKVRSKEVIPSSLLNKSNKSSLEELQVPKEEDKISEAGTYTIEDEKDRLEEDEARKNIDKIFGVDQVSLVQSTGDNLSDDLKEQLRKSDKQGELTLNLQNINLELAEIEMLERRRARPCMVDSLEAELGSTATEVCDDSTPDDDEKPSVPQDAPEWVSQWAALTNQKVQNGTGDMELSSPGSSISDEGKPGRRVNGLSRKRPGTGRRLPTIPPGTSSPAMSDRSSTKGSPRLSKCDLTVNGTAAIQTTPRQRAVKISSHVTAKYEDTDSESISLTKYGSEVESPGDISSRGKDSSNASIVSIDTDVLLRDTETVMQAMEKRHKQPTHESTKGVDGCDSNYLQENGYSDGISYSQTVVSQGDTSIIDNDSALLDESADFESDTSSVVALVNGDEDFVKPTYYKSPRDVLGKGKFKLAESLPSKPSVNMSGASSKAKSSDSDRQRKRSTDESKTVVSDVFSDVNFDTTARTNDTIDTDASQFSRQGSKGKGGQMSMTRPNRAFALRRARADGEEPPDSARSTASTASVSTASTGFKTPRGGGSLSNLTRSGSSTPQKPRRPMSGVYDRSAPDSSRTQDSSRSQASLGTKIVQKSRENLNTGFGRADGGRHSLRVVKSLSIPARHSESPGSSASTRQRKPEGTSSTNLQHSKSLRVTGVSAKERSNSVSRSNRTNSPKSAERNAWKRRKDYDPRRAVAEAKQKTRTDPKRRSEGVESFNRARGVTRSASFTNTKDLKLSSYKCDSASSTDEHSRRSSGASDVFEDNLRRGFVPYSGRSLVSNSSVDDEEMERSARSSSAQSSTVTESKSKRVSRISARSQAVSAFTPPPRQPIPLSVYKPTPRARSSTRSSRAKFTLKTPSPTPVTSVAYSRERRSVDSLKLHHYTLPSARSEHSDTSQKVPESYDSLIVSSVYQLSLKLKTQTDRTMEKLRDSDVIENGLESPLDELEGQCAISEIPAYKSANQELASVLKNLRKIEQHIKIMTGVLFPDDASSPDTSREKQEYMMEIERIKNELAGFQPIETPRDDVWTHAETASIESDCEELGTNTEYY
ncbi:uncharacterized protein LOC128207571 isoform X3 [Mya arenaria]|uniref:uncharacterized protein LOC128207571 isoform X3 n=1 Tax=Mya arenaria TaxID=6604 RepID=UPI0022E88D4D|nr:uncharacterized protein LOC128207571 isoform X3 [Mya arenaria]